VFWAAPWSRNVSVTACAVKDWWPARLVADLPQHAATRNPIQGNGLTGGRSTRVAAPSAGGAEGAGLEPGPRWLRGGALRRPDLGRFVTAGSSGIKDAVVGIGGAGGTYGPGKPTQATHAPGERPVNKNLLQLPGRHRRHSGWSRQRPAIIRTPSQLINRPEPVKLDHGLKTAVRQSISAPPGSTPASPPPGGVALAHHHGATGMG